MKSKMIERAITTICKERKRDAQGSIPIDVMAAQKPLPVTNQHVIAGREQAERLLPIAKRLVPPSLSRLADVHDLEAIDLNWIVARVETVNTIEAEVEKHDNASWRPTDPHAIIFGTIFLAGLRSDEAMITVLAHELTHAINGTDQTLRPLFIRVGTRASHLRGSPIGEEASLELTCEMVGVQVVQEYIARTSSGETMGRRLARSLEKDCVHQDLADEIHLSPLETMRLLLILKPDLTVVLQK